MTSRSKHVRDNLTAYYSKHVRDNLTAYHHGELQATERAHIEDHLQQCTDCRTAYEEIRFGAGLASMLSITKAPASIWEEIQKAKTTPRHRQLPRFAAAGVALAALIVSVILVYHLPSAPAWDILSSNGTNLGRIRTGEAFETNGSLQALVNIANIGRLTIEPNTRIRLLVTRPDQHRIALDRGKVEAVTVAPPRLFIVETPAATAVDLGCSYSLEVQNDGSGLLHVTSGRVALERDGRETIVPAGAFCRTRRGSGPGTPFYEDSSSALQSALDYLDTAKNGTEYDAQLEIVLRESRGRDALSLWYLIPHVDPVSRGRIYDRLAELLPPPPGVSRDGIVALDTDMLAAWEKVVSQLWQ